MPNKIGEAVLIIKANAKGLKSGLDKAQKATGSAVKGMQAKFQGFANRIPVVGGALAGLATPAGLATAAIGLTVGVLTKMVTKTLDLGRSLGTARETLGVSAEAIQIYRRAIEETNGDAKSFDQSVLRLTRSIGEAGTGNKTYQEDFERIGLSYEDLARMSPEDALKAVTGAINEQLDPADGAAVKAALLGRGYAGMGGFANLTTAEIEELTASVADSAVVMGGDAVTNVDEYDAAMRDMRDMFGKVAIAVGTQLIPKITNLVTSFMSVAEALWPVISILNTPLKVAFNTITGAIDVLAKLLKGDFRGAWNAVLDTALSVMENIVNVYNNTLGRLPRVAQIDMEQVRQSLDGVRAEVEDDLNPALEDTKGAMDDTTASARDLTAAAGELEEKASTTAERVLEWKEAQEQADRAGGDMEAQVRGQVIPTLAELEEQLDAAAEAEAELAQATVDSAADQLAASAAVDDLRQTIFLEFLRRQGELRREAQETADELAEADKEAADAAQREIDRINSSWETFRVNQDEVVQAMNESSVTFEDVVVELADQFGISTIEMAQRAASMGINYGDTLAFMEAFGRERIAGIVADLALVEDQADDTAKSLSALEQRQAYKHNQGVEAAQHASLGARADMFAQLPASVRSLLVSQHGANALNALPTPQSLTAEQRQLIATGTITLTDGFDDVVGEAMVRIDERGG